MEVGVRVEAEDLRTGAITHLVYVSLGPDRRPQPVPPPRPETAEDHRRQAEAQARQHARLASRKPRSGAAG
jgi:acyl-CoA hydrolase